MMGRGNYPLAQPVENIFRELRLLEWVTLLKNNIQI